MKIESISLIRLRNDEHFQLVTELRKLITKHGAEALKIEALFSAFLPLYGAEDEALKKVVKSALTAEIQEKDKRRDHLFRGMVDANKSALNHFRPEVQKAATRLKIVLDTYGNVVEKPLSEETSALYNLLQDIRNKYAQDAATVGLTEWVEELDAVNEAFGQLLDDRYEETSTRCDLVLKQCRHEVDEVYRAIVERINALAVVEGAAAYEGFIRNLNAIIDKCAAMLAHRHGKGGAAVGSEQ
jgi:ElaB/YqjD/DUF883 family membrane-anchored ribosome-binding protein